jgi:hypothetical protein
VALVAALVPVSAEAAETEEPNAAPAPDVAVSETPPVVDTEGPTLELGPLLSKEGSAGTGRPAIDALPIRNSTFFFDQSITTQTVDVGGTPQSYVPLYEWWFSIRPRWYLSDELYVTGRLDYTKEFTNDQPTTNYRADVFGDAWTGLTYEARFSPKLKDTKGSLGGLFRWPLSAQSQAEGVYVKTGIVGGLKQRVPIRGADAPLLNDVHFRLGAWYEHPFTQATTPVGGSFGYVRQDTEGRSFVSDQIAGTTNIDHSLQITAEAAVQITPKLDLTLDMLFLNNWRYAPTDNVSVPVAGGSVMVPRSSDAPLYESATWFLATVTYNPWDEVGLSLGYYNLQNALSPSGQHRTLFGSDNVWWSPDARFFFTITAHLDALYVDAANRRAAAATPQAARLAP